MLSSSSKSISSVSQKYSFDSVDDACNLPPPLSHNDALNLAKNMYKGLNHHIKDRMYRFKSYKNCFKHSHALDWALENIDSDKRVAIQRLNELVDWGLIYHVVDPTRRFLTKETRTLYFRINIDALSEKPHDDEGDRSNTCDVFWEVDKQKHSRATIMRRNAVAVQVEAIQTKIDGLDHVLQETVKDLNAANGRLEFMSQQASTLISQQISLFGALFVLSICSVLPVLPRYVGSSSWASRYEFLVIFLAIVLGKCGMTVVRSFNLFISTQVASFEFTDDESTVDDDSDPSKVVVTYTKRPSFTQMVSERILRKSSKRLGIVREASTVLSREACSLPEVETWSHRPLLICVNTPVSMSLKVPHYGQDSCPLGKPFKFSSDLFEGTCLIRIKDSNSDNVERDSEYFSGRKRIFQSVVQGRFKEDGLRVSDVLTGHEFARPLKNLPHPWILKTASNFIERVAPGSSVVVHTDQPYVKAILAGTSQAVRGDEPGNEPHILSRDIQEDCSIFGGIFTKNVSTSRRKRIFSNPNKAQQYKFDTETIYTFEFYQNLFDANSYALDLGFTKIGCSKVLDGQPIQWLGKLQDGRYLWSFQIWHEKLVSDEGNGYAK